MQHLIKDLTILLLVSLPINILFHKIKLPSIMGFLIAGILIGPNGLHWVGDSETVKDLAEIGVILLLFVIGLEFSLRGIIKNLMTVIGVGGIQIALTVLAVFLICVEMGMPTNQGIAFGLLIALSSTAIVLKMITDRAELDTTHGQICVGVLLFQDLCVVPMMLIIPLLAQGTGFDLSDLGLALLKSIAAVSFIFILSRLIVPRTLGIIVRLGSKEHLTLFVILIILGTGWACQVLELSLAMGAFIAGLILSESEYNHQIILDILPLRDYFGGIFFISIGMLLQVQIFFDSPLWFLGITAGIIFLKAFLGSLATLMLKTPLRISFIVGVRLAQVVEFSLLMASVALSHGLFSGIVYQRFLLISVLSMLAAPLLIQASSRLSIKLFSKWPIPSGPADDREVNYDKKLTGHVIIAGYGLVGRNLSRVLKEINIPFLVLDQDGETVKQALAEKISIHYGDSTRLQTLLSAGIEEARVIVYAIPDHIATEQGVRLARKLNPDIHILVRTRFTSQVEELKAAGADQVIPEEFETSIEIFSRVLREFHIANNVIEQQVELVRLEGYSMFRGLSLSIESLGKFATYLTASLTESFHVSEDSWAKEKTLKEINLPERTGAKLIALVREDRLYANPDESFRINAGDILILFGRHVQLDSSIKTLKSGPAI